jgi:hypothetical protein
MVTGVTASGFEYTIDERRVRSWSMVKKIAAMQGTNNDMAIYGIAIDLISDLLGEEQEQKLVNHVAQLYGYDDAEIVSKEFFEIIGSVRQDQGLKNSSSSPVAFQPTRMPSSATLQKPTESMIGTPPMTFPSSPSLQQG